MHSSSDLEAIQQQLAAMRSTVAASAAARNSKAASMPAQPYPPYNSSMAPKSMLDSAEIEREVSDIIAQGGSGGLAPPKLDRSESLLSPAAAKHLARYREQVRNLEPNPPSAPYGGATKSAAPFQYATDRSAAPGNNVTWASHEAGSNATGIGASASRGADMLRAGWGGFGSTGATGTGLDAGAASTRSSTVGSIGSIGSSLATGGPALTQRPPYTRPRSVVRSLEPTLSGAASQSGHRL